MNSAFASYATGSAFRIDLTRRMVWALMAATNGAKINTGNHGVLGLVQRGLMEITEGQERQMYKAVRLTEAGVKLAELCVLAGLGAKESKHEEIQ